MRTACLTMQKDETLLLRPWLLHHGDLFGFQNLYVFDNGSTDPTVIATLSAFQRHGVNVIWDQNTPAHFDSKGKVVGDKILELRAARTHDIALPLDGDQFAAVQTPSGLSCRRADIITELSRLNAGGKIARTAQCLFNLPGRFNEFRIDWHAKCIMPISLFNGIDHGFHQAHTPAGESYAPTTFTYLHFHNKPFDHLRDGAANKLGPWVDVADREALKNYQGTGKHLVKYLFISKSEYYQTAPDQKTVYTGLTDKLAAFMDMRPTIAAWEAQ